MGLFGKPKAQPCETIEEFLQQESADDLKRLALNNLNLSFSDNKLSENFFSPRAGVSMEIWPNSYYSISDSVWYDDFKHYCKHKIPSKFKDDCELVPNILEFALDKGHDPNVAFILGMNNEFNLMDNTWMVLEQEFEPFISARAQYFYDLANQYGCRLMAYLDYLRTAAYNHDIFANRTEFILNNLYFYTTSDCTDETAKEMVKSFLPDDIKVLKLLSTLGIVFCQMKGYPLSTLSLSGYMKKLANGENDNFFDPSVYVYSSGKDPKAFISIAVKIWKRAQAGDPLAQKACAMFGTAF